MAKSKSTENIEKALNTMCREKRLYGCEEVTIGFPNNGYGNEIVDFMLMDSKGILRCYEIKVSVSDLSSRAKKSWYGNYNYLVTTEVLYQKISDWTIYIPGHVGIIVYEDNRLLCKRKPVKRELSSSEQLMVKESLIRSLTWKTWKYKDAGDPLKWKQIQAEVRKWQKKYKLKKEECEYECEEKCRLRHVIRKYRKVTGIDIEQYIDRVEEEETQKRISSGH